MKKLFTIILILSFIRVCQAQTSVTLNNFSKADSTSYSWQFPKDHGSHDSFETEWWYFTGNLYKENKIAFKDKPSYGFQLTFFRRATISSDNSIHQSYLAHGAISDFENNSFSFDSIQSPAVLNFAGANSNFLSTWNRNWFTQSVGNRLFLNFSLENSSCTLKLSSPDSNIKLQGINGLSKKGFSQNSSSYYYSIPSLDLDGQIELESTKLLKLHGIGWMDHEFMTNSLSSSQEGWDWFSISLKDGRKLMLFRVRDKDRVKDFLSGSIIDLSNEAITLKSSDFIIKEIDYWTSQKTKAKYPVSWHIQIPDQNISLNIKVRIQNQELSFPNQTVSSYYEGAVFSEDESAIGYVEMTGYADSISSAGL